MNHADFLPRGAPFEVRLLTVVIPVYNSEATIGRLVDRTLEALEPLFPRVEMVLVNDGSRDGSHDEAAAAARRHAGKVKYIRLARNFGEHNAVMCGLHHAAGDAVAIIDDDFQNPLGEIVNLVRALAEGYDVVYGRYESKKHHPFRNLGSRFNDVVATRLLGKPPGLYLSSFKALNAFLAGTVIEYRGPFPYLDGLILRATDNIGRVPVLHTAREEGRSNYTLRRLVGLWLNMFTGFSIVPLRVASYLGLGMALAGLIMAVFFIVSRLVGGILATDRIPPGWASLIVSITLFSGVQLCMLGMLGEYLGRVFLTQNQSPQFVVRETVDGSGRVGNDEDGRGRDPGTP